MTESPIPMSEEAGPSILVIEDEPAVARELETLLRAMGYGCGRAAGSQEEALARAAESPPELVIADVCLGGAQDGIETASVLRARWQTPVIFVSAHSDVQTLERAIAISPYGYLLRPLRERELQATVELALGRRQLERVLARRERELTAAHRLGQLGSWEWELQSDRLKPSRELLQILDLDEESPTAISAATLLARLHPDDHAQLQTQAQALRVGGGDAEHRCRIIRRSGEVRSLRTWTELERDAQGRPSRLLGVSQDVTELERGLAAQAANRAKAVFLAHVSHELRTPLSGVMGFAELLLEQEVGSLTATQETYVQHILEGGRHLLRLVNDVLDLSRVEAGKLRLRRQPLQLDAVLDQVLPPVKVLAAQAGLELRIELAPELPELSGDPSRLRQILLNLLSNAIKFTQRGRVTLRVGSHAGGARIDVLDTGRGIRREDLPRLFVEFEQLGDRAKDRSEGVGLGLALTRRLVELHGGSITVRSEIGRGSRFRVWLPGASLPAPPR